jgi:non-heme chloroperoxidase
MRIWIALMVLTCVGVASPLHAQTLVGTWQAIAGNLRVVLKVTKRAGGTLRGETYYVGQEFSGNTLNGNPISSIKVEGGKVTFDLDESPGTFDGTLAADGKSLTGNWTAQGEPRPLKFDRATKETAWVIDPSPHEVTFVPVENDVRLEVLDWGGDGPPLLFLAGHGNTAHVFDAFALKFTETHHVYGITRRGFGLSSKPLPTDENYDADRLGDDVLAVIDALELNRPAIAGHSLAGEELSSIGTRRPERVSGLIYLDASYDYAFYNENGTNDALNTNLSIMRRNALQLVGTLTPAQLRTVIQEMQTTMPRLQADLQRTSKLIERWPEPTAPLRQTLRDKVTQYILTGARKYTAIKGPVLAIVALPPACAGNCDAPDVKAREADVAAQTDAFEMGTPQARVVRIPQAQHYVFLSNEADVVREMTAFMDGLR